jgi:hypothetical protein
MLLPRHCTTLSIPLLALPLSCTGDGPNDDEVGDGDTETGDGDGDGDTETGDGDGDGGLCTEPGTVVPDFDPFVPAESDPLPTCSTGWASTAPLQDANWVAMIPTEDYGYYSSNPGSVKGLSGGAALLISEQSLQWYDGQGVAVSEVDHGFPVFPGVRSSAVVVREADDHVFIAGSLDSELVIREFADGAMVSELIVPTPGEGSNAIGLFEFSTDEWLIVGDEYDPVEFNTEAFFMRVDATGTQVLRKATSLGYSYYYNSLAFAGLDGDDNLLFGSTSQQWIVDPNDGSVINPSVGLGGLRDLVGSAAGSGFVTATFQSNASQDAVASLINGFGANQWTQVYDRALTGEIFFDVDARPEGGFVAGGVDGIWWQQQPYQDASQPMILAFDGQGNAEWIGRLAIPGSTRSVDVASDGGIVATGTARMGGTDYNDVDSYIWIASW